MIRNLLESRRTYLILIISNVLVTMGLFIATRHETGGDIDTYVGLADGILHGRYSFWWFAPGYYPDTFRNPGYSLVLAAVRLLTDSLMAVRIIQFFIYFGAVYLSLKIIGYYTSRLITRNIFLILLLMNINTAAYITLIYPEILTLFLITLSIYLDLKMDSAKWLKYLLLGLIYGFIFQVRPVFLFVPFIKLAYDWWCRKERPFNLAYQVIIFAVFYATMMPYAYWNKVNNGVFSVTPLEGGGGLIHASYWSPRLTNYMEHRYWSNAFQQEIISERDTNKVKENIIAFNKEWDYVDSVCQPYLTAKDTALMNYRTAINSDTWLTYNAKYVLAREKVLKQLAMKHMMEDIPYTLRNKTYSFFRVWFTGIFSNTKLATVRYKNIVNYLSPYFIVSVLSFVIFILALVFLPLAIFMDRTQMARIAYPILLLLYCGAIHMPFTIQSRYTTPVRLLLILCIAIALTTVFFPDKEKQEKVGV